MDDSNRGKKLTVEQVADKVVYAADRDVKIHYTPFKTLTIKFMYNVVETFSPTAANAYVARRVLPSF